MPSPPHTDIESPTFIAARLVAEARSGERHVARRKLMAHIGRTVQAVAVVGLFLAYPAAELHDRLLPRAVWADLPVERNWRLEQVGLARTVLLDIAGREGWRADAPLWSPRARNANNRIYQIETVTGLAELAVVLASAYPSHLPDRARDITSAGRLLGASVAPVRNQWSGSVLPGEALASLRAAEAAMGSFDARISREWVGRALPTAGLTATLGLIARWLRRTADDLALVSGSAMNAGPALARAKALAALGARLLEALAVDYRVLIEERGQTETVAAVAAELKRLARTEPVFVLNWSEGHPLGASHAAEHGFRALQVARDIDRLVASISPPSP